MKSSAEVMGVEEGRPERRAVYVKLSCSNGEDSISIAGACRPRIEALAERIIIWVDGHYGTIGQPGGILRLGRGGGGR